jgi:hypothetical protein
MNLFYPKIATRGSRRGRRRSGEKRSKHGDEFFLVFFFFDVQVGWWLFFSQIPMTTQKGN